jgi:hypothetical protein
MDFHFNKDIKESNLPRHMPTTKKMRRFNRSSNYEVCVASVTTNGRESGGLFATLLRHFFLAGGGNFFLCAAIRWFLGSLHHLAEDAVDVLVHIARGFLLGRQHGPDGTPSDVIKVQGPVNQTEAVPVTPKALRSLRISIGMTLEEFAARLKIKSDDLHAWETGDRPVDVRRVMKAIERLRPKAERDTQT